MIRVMKNGQALTERVWALLDDAREAAGLSEGSARVIQGSWARGTKSAGTHEGNGAFDLSVSGLTEGQQLALVNELRKRNAKTWLRSPKFGWPVQVGGSHIHGIVADEPGLSVAARAQVLAYRLGRNGLASRKKDPHARPKALKFVLPGDVKLKDLRYGRTNGSVRALQKALGIAQDGLYGVVTDAAVRKHQRDNHILPVDRPRRSYVGPKQAKILGLG